jgi:type IV secretory pathway VirJ component
VLFLSGDGGWNLGVLSMAKTLVAQGAMVVGISTPAFIQALEKDGATCEYADGDLENLSHYIQAYAKLPNYITPIIVGYSSGATLAYAMLAQSPDGTFAGAVALGFCPDLDMHKPLCKADGVEFTPRKDGKGVDFLPVQRIKVPFIAMQGEIDQVCEAKATQAFIAQVPNAEVVMLPKVGHGYSVEKNWMPQYKAAFAKLTERQARPAAVPIPKDVSDLPLIELPAVQGSPESDSYAILMSGDGGWAGLDKEVAAALAAKGIPVVGVDSLRYYWTPRTPEGAAADVDRLIRFYSAHWNKKHVLLIGYSQGADVLPFIYNRLPDESRSLVTLAVPIGIGEKAAFEFHLTNWVGDSGTEATMPEMEKFAGSKILFCVFGQGEKDSLCTKLDPQRFRVQQLPGGHHFNGDYDKLAAAIIGALP